MAVKTSGSLRTTKTFTSSFRSPQIIEVCGTGIRSGRTLNKKDVRAINSLFALIASSWSR
jgi:hypothetical protein